MHLNSPPLSLFIRHSLLVWPAPDHDWQAGHNADLAVRREQPWGRSPRVRGTITIRAMTETELAPLSIAVEEEGASRGERTVGRASPIDDITVEIDVRSEWFRG
jgi:hypothetical protein